MQGNTTAYLLHKLSLQIGQTPLITDKHLQCHWFITQRPAYYAATYVSFIRNNGDGSDVTTSRSVKKLTILFTLTPLHPHIYCSCNCNNKFGTPIEHLSAKYNYLIIFIVCLFKGNFLIHLLDKNTYNEPPLKYYHPHS